MSVPDGSGDHKRLQEANNVNNDTPVKSRAKRSQPAEKKRQKKVRIKFIYLIQKLCKQTNSLQKSKPQLSPLSECSSDQDAEDNCSVQSHYMEKSPSPSSSSNMFGSATNEEARPFSTEHSIKLTFLQPNDENFVDLEIESEDIANLDHSSADVGPPCSSSNNTGSAVRNVSLSRVLSHPCNQILYLLMLNSINKI